jgi:hypothetical protein
LYEGERLSEGENGLIVKEEELPPDVSGWSMFDLHGVAFPTLGARRVRTAFLDDAPVATIFDDNGQQTGVVTYELDDHRRVLRAVLYGGAASPLADQSFARFRTEGTVVEPQAGLEHVRTEFAYDAQGRLARREVSLVGLRKGVESYEYNEQGDVIRIASHDGRPDVRLEYAYDEHGNWIRKTTHHALGADEEIRSIQYYADETIGV